MSADMLAAKNLYTKADVRSGLRRLEPQITAGSLRAYHATMQSIPEEQQVGHGLFVIFLGVLSILHII